PRGKARCVRSCVAVAASRRPQFFVERVQLIEAAERDQRIAGRRSGRNLAIEGIRYLNVQCIAERRKYVVGVRQNMQSVAQPDGQHATEVAVVSHLKYP